MHATVDALAWLRMWCLAALATLCVVGGATPVKIIIDTDLSIDVDDVGALCAAHALADLGEAEILGIVHGTGFKSGVGGIMVINEFYGRSHIPVGAYRGRVGHPGWTVDPGWTNHGRGAYVEELIRDFPTPVKDWNHRSIEDAEDVMRSVLAAADPHSVVLVVIGHPTNILTLLETKADMSSPLSGPALIRQKVYCPGASNHLRHPGCWVHYHRLKDRWRIHVSSLSALVWPICLPMLPALPDLPHGYSLCVFDRLPRWSSWEGGSSGPRTRLSNGISAAVGTVAAHTMS
mgnify:CR=1 FL=1|jgi:hypothetical protein